MCDIWLKLEDIENIYVNSTCISSVLRVTLENFQLKSTHNTPCSTLLVEHEVSLLYHIQGFIFLLQEKFLPFIDMFQKESVKVEVCKNVAEAFNKYIFLEFP